MSRLYRTPPLFTRLCGEESTCGEWQRLRLSTAWAIQLGSWTDGAVCSSGSISSNIFVAWEVPRNGCMPAAGPTTAHNAGETIHGKYPLTLERKQNLRCGKPAWCSNELFPAWPQRKKHGLIILVTVALISSCLSPWSISHREWTYWCSLTIVLHLCQSQAWVRSQAPAPWALRWWSPGNFQPPKIQQAYVRGWSVAIGSHWKFVRKIVHFESFKGTILLLHFELA